MRCYLHLWWYLILRNFLFQFEHPIFRERRIFIVPLPACQGSWPPFQPLWPDRIGCGSSVVWWVRRYGDDKINIEVQFVISLLSTWRGRPCLVVGAVHRTFQCPKNWFVCCQQYNLLLASKMLLDYQRPLISIQSIQPNPIPSYQPNPIPSIHI